MKYNYWPTGMHPSSDLSKLYWFIWGTSKSRYTTCLMSLHGCIEMGKELERLTENDPQGYVLDKDFSDD